MNASGDGNNNYPMHPDRMMHPENEQRRKGKGRQKIEMAKIENDTNLQVTFSKRRAGVFKKASELGVLCGAEYAVVVYSPGEKPHSFGNPSVEAVTTRFLQASGGGGGAPPARGTIADRRVMAHQEAAQNQRNQEVVTAEARVEQAKQRRRELDSMPPVLQMENLSYEQLEQLRNSVLMYKQGVQAKFSGGAGVYGYGGVTAPVYGQNVQYPPMGYNYGDPYNAATGSFNAYVGGAHAGANYGEFPGSSGANINSAQGGANYGGFPGSSDASIDGAQGGANYGGFPGNYYHHHPGY